jgi:hypothetical protein
MTENAKDLSDAQYAQGEGPAAGGSERSAGVSQEEIQAAMATYSGDGQGDDATGGDALAEIWQAREADRPENAPTDRRPTPDTADQGPTTI